MSARIGITKFAEIAHYMPDALDEHQRRMHGHSIQISVVASGLVWNGVVIDFDRFEAIVGKVVGRIDHSCLNESVPEISPPTLENLAAWLFHHIVRTEIGTRLESVRIDRPSCGQWAEWSR
jgi:6-pyruvoyl-tetrahydropterin synthase